MPWEALASAVATARAGLSPGTLRLAFAHPELVRRRGLVIRPQTIVAEDVDAVFLESVVRYYLTHPQLRSSIGTEAGYQNLLYAVSGPGPAQAGTPL